MNESLGQRIRRLRKQVNLSQAQLAEACGWKSQSRVGNYEVGSREPNLADIAAMARALRVDPSQLLLNTTTDAHTEQGLTGSTSLAIVRDMLAKNGRGLPDQVRQKILAAAQSPNDEADHIIPAALPSLKAKSDEILIPQYDIRGAMGHGQVPADYNEAIRNLIVREDVLREKGVTYTSAASLAIITGWGQSMEGTINDQDPVIVDRGVNEFIGEGVYVVTWHGLLYIKRLQMVDEEHLRMISDNKHYENQTARLDDVAIHAKVLLVWNAQKL